MLEIVDADEDAGLPRRLRMGWLSVWWPFPVARSIHSSAATVFGWSVYGENTPWLIRKVFAPTFRRLSDARYWVLYRVTKRHAYHIIYTGLPPGYHDENDRILHGCMTCLGRYVDEAGGINGLAAWSAEVRGGDNGMNHQADNQDEAAAIWQWWTVERPRDEARKDELCGKLYGRGRMKFVQIEGSKFSEIQFEEFTGEEERLHEEFRAIEKKISDDEVNYLVRLMKIHQSLWT